jgi:hypothetical protein
MSALPATVNLTAYRGDSWQQTFRLLDSAGNPIDLIGSTVAAWAALNGDQAIVLTTTIGPDPGLVTMKLPTTITVGAYRYDLEVSGLDATVKTWIRGRLVVEQDVTNRP